MAVEKLIRSRQYRRIVIASCHEDIVPWLRPDWIFSTSDGSLTLTPFRAARAAPPAARLRLVVDVDSPVVESELAATMVASPLVYTGAARLHDPCYCG